ncbi:MAG: hypothetical protein K0S38_812 [Candidatus Paceibacter sp.]|jgi:hypothetical protein|nr:hypothetical protein [Candidatus Paceibacter sp.]
MNKNTLIVIIVIVLAAAGIVWFINMDSSIMPESVSSTDAAYNNATTTDGQLNAIEQENNNQDFSGIESDFGAEVNAAAQ